MGWQDKDWYRRTNESFGRHGVVWAVLLLALPFVSLGALAGYLASTADWYWQHLGWLGVLLAVLVAWILLGCALLIVRAMWSPEWLKLKLPPPQAAPIPAIVVTDNRDWFSVRSSLSNFIDKALYKRMTTALDASLENINKQRGIQEQINNLTSGPTFNGVRSTLQAEIIRLQAKAEPLDTAYKVALDGCLFDLKVKLSKGKLIAKGYKCPYHGDSDPEIIKADQWHALNFDRADKDFQTVKVDGLKYIGIQIAVP